MSRHRNKALIAVLLCCAGISYANMNPLHSPGNKFTRILGIDLMQDRLHQVLAKLGKSPIYTSGDAADYMGRTCYRMGDSKTTIGFYEFELGAGFFLRYTKTSDYARCALLKGQKYNGHVEINGLKLGISKDTVLKILGKPTKRTQNKWTYDLSGTARDNNAVERSIYSTSLWDKQYPYYWNFLIQVGFKGSAVSSLDLMPYTQQ